MEKFGSGADGAGSMLLTVEEAAGHLRLSPSYLNKLRVFGGGPAFCKIGRRVLYRPVDLDVWVSQHRHLNTSEFEPQSRAA